MRDRRQNWKADAAHEAQARAERKAELQAQLDQTRQAIRECGADYARYDQLKSTQREIVAKLATL